MKKKKNIKSEDAKNKKKIPKKVVNYLLYTVGAVTLVLLIAVFFGKKEHGLSGGANLELPDPAADRQDLATKQDQYKDLDLNAQKSYGQSLDEMFMSSIAATNHEESSGGVTTEATEDPYATLTATLDESQKSMENFQVSLQEQRQQQQAEETSEREKELEAALQESQMRLKAQEEAEKTMSAILEESRQTAAAYQEEREKQEAAHQRRVEQRENIDLTEVRAIARADDGRDGLVSTLSGYHRHVGFYGMGGSEETTRNTIRATVYGKQTLLSGQQLSLRLSEPMLVGTQVLPAGSILSGNASIGIDRLYVTVTSIVYNQVLTVVNLEVYDVDGQRGLFVPGSMENEALRDFGKEVTSSMASTTEQSVTSLVNTTKASEQLKTDLARGGIQGVARFIEKKLDQIRITVQDGHQVLLFPNR